MKYVPYKNKTYTYIVLLKEFSDSILMFLIKNCKPEKYDDEIHIIELS